MTTPVIPNPSTPFLDQRTGLVRREWFLFLNSLINANVTSVAVTGANGIGVAGSPITSAGTIALSLGALTPTSVAATGTVTGSNLSGTNTGDQTITLSGDISGSGTGAITTAIGNNKVTNAMLAQMAASTIKGNNTAGVANAADLTVAQVQALVPLLSKVITFTRDPAAANGSVSYTGAGFKPRALISLGAQGTSVNIGFHGFCDSALGQSSVFDGTNFNESNTAFLTVGVAGANQAAAVTSLDSDGFTVTWTKTGAPGGAVYNCAVLCLS